MSPKLESLLSLCEEYGASDLHLTAGYPPRFRISGAMEERGGIAPYQVRDVDDLAMELGLYTLPVGSPDGTEKVRINLMKCGSIDGALTSPTGARYRFNVYRELSRHAVAIRRLDSRFKTFSELSLPSRIASFCDERDGLVVVTGPTGSGKSTTLATMIDSINKSRAGHIITIEDPVEYVHKSDRCFVNHRQVGRDAVSFNAALVESLRQDPDVILVGEMRDTDTVRTALRAAETGHLVFATLHAGDCAGAVERLISVFPADEQNSARHQLSLVLRGICAQHLLSSVDGTTRYPACEILVNTSASANLIASGRSAQLYSVIETGRPYGMRTLDQSLAELISAGLVSERRAMAISKNPDILKGRVNAVGR